MKSTLFILFLLTTLNVLGVTSKKSDVSETSINKDSLIQKMMQEALMNFKEKKYDHSIVICEKILAIDSLNYKAYRYLADAQYAVKKYDESIVNYNKSIQINTKDTLSYKGRAESTRQNKDFQKALWYYALALKMDTTDLVMFFGRAICYEELDKNEEAVEDLSKCLKTWTESSVCYYYRGVAYYNLRKYKEAISDFNKNIIIKDEGYYKKSILMRGVTYLALSIEGIPKLDSALIDLIYMIHLEPKNSECYKYLGMVYRMKDDTINSRKCYQYSIDLKASNDTYYEWASSEMYFGNYSKAKELMDTVIVHLSPEKLKTGSRYYYRRGEAEYNSGDTLSGIRDISRAIDMNPNNVRYRGARLIFAVGSIGVVKFKNIILEDIDFFMKSNKSTQTRIANMYMLRGYFKFKIKDTLSCIQDMDSAVVLRPNIGSYYLWRSVYRFEISMKNEKNIMSDIDKAISLSPDLGDLYYVKAIFNANYNDCNQACKNYKKALKLGFAPKKEIENFTCKGILPEGEKRPYVPFIVYGNLLREISSELNGNLVKITSK